jgi:hypothetical protein
MSCDTNKFVISKGVNNNFTFTIKQDNSTLPLSIEAADTFLADLIPLGDAFEFAGDMPTDTFNDIVMAVEDAPNGKISLAISESDTQWLVIDKGARVDRYYTRPTYKLVLKCNTVNNGNFIAKVPEVYVD